MIVDDEVMRVTQARRAVATSRILVYDPVPDPVVQILPQLLSKFSSHTPALMLWSDYPAWDAEDFLQMAGWATLQESINPLTVVTHWAAWFGDLIEVLRRTPLSYMPLPVRWIIAVAQPDWDQARPVLGTLVDNVLPNDVTAGWVLWPRRSANQIEWLNMRYPEAQYVFPSSHVAQTWVDALSADFVPYLSYYAGYATPDAHVFAFLWKALPRWMQAHQVKATIYTGSERDLQTHRLWYKIWWTPMPPALSWNFRTEPNQP